MQYTKLDEKSLQEILQQYEIGPTVDWKVLEGGSQNTNYLIETAAKKYVLTICEKNTIEEASSLVDLLKYLETYHFKTTAVISNKSGQNSSVFKDKPIILKTYLSGQIVTKPNKNLLEQIGRSIGELHLIPAPDYLPKVYSFGEQVFPQLQQNKVDHPFVDWLASMHPYIKEHLSTDLPKALIHGDVFFNNVIIDETNRPMIIDFEEACYYYRVYDIGMAMVGLCNEEGIINFSKVEHLLKGYEQIIPLETLEKESLKAFTAYAATSTAYWRFCQFNIIAPTPSRKDTYLEMQGIADQMRNLLA